MDDQEHGESNAGPLCFTGQTNEINTVELLSRKC